MTLIEFMQTHYQDFKELSLVLMALLAYTVFSKDMTNDTKRKNRSNGSL